jgi:transcriptional regulator with XRE-family HTH domain
VEPISQQLRGAIDASGLSRYRICKEIGLPESTMSQFMSGRCGLQLSTIDRLAELLGLQLISPARSPKKQGR